MRWSTHKYYDLRLATRSEKLEVKDRVQPVPVHERDAWFREHMAFDGARDFALMILHTQHECISTMVLAELGSGVLDFARMEESKYY